MSYKGVLALFALAIVMLVGCKQPVGVPSSRVHAATIQKESCYVQININSGHFDWYQDSLAIWWHYSWSYGDPIRRAYDCSGNPPRAYPRKDGYRVFNIPYFVSTEVPSCTLCYYQTAHNGSASLLVNTWQPDGDWPPGTTWYNYDFWAIENSTNTVATDIAHATDGCWYKVPLTYAACTAIRETSLVYGPDGGGQFWTGWVYRGSVNGTYTDVRGYDGSDNHAPFIRVVYDDGQ